MTALTTARACHSAHRPPSARTLGREFAQTADRVMALIPLAMALDRGEALTEERVAREIGAVRFGHLLPKIAPIPGSLHLEFMCCGRPTCRCADGEQLHGAYWYHRWRHKGRQHKEYVPARELARVKEGIALWR